MDAIAILDIGKTHVKVALVAGGRVVELRQGDSGEGPPPPYLHLPTEAQWSWAAAQLRELSRLAHVTDIVPVAHGASIAVIDDKGLVLPMLDYQQEISEFDREYEKLARDFAATLSPRLPCGHNTGRQLFWLQRKFPKEFVRATAIVGLAQYWAWRLSGVAVSELTALGNHTDLWRPRARDFSALVSKAGWRKLFPPIHAAGDIIGTILPEVAMQTSLPADCRVRAGIHDSNAAFLRWRLRLAEPFTVLSTGTWIVPLAAGGEVPADGARLDCLGNVDALGNLVAGARFMGGREYEVIRGDAADDQGTAEQRLADLIARPCFALPAFSDQGGPFSGTRGRFTDLDGNTAIPWRRATLAALYCALMTDLQLELLQAKGPILVEGPFATNDVYITALAALRPDSPVHPSLETLGTSLGAAMLVDPDLPTEIPPAAPRPNIDLTLYRAYWRTLSGAKKLLTPEAIFFN
ncbi:MAG TPA: FGGY family carbohydrate kinase [Dongiaceae bacterium]|nr:FGGY family carbohydrate kinase [Dongiaceae bacterium]